MKRSEEKGRRKARKARLVARSKPDTRLRPPVPPSAAIIEALTLERQKMLSAIRDLLRFYDHVPTWSPTDPPEDRSADLRRLAEIRELVTRCQ
jgi:hypothetical protein